ncbi:hypothetical protein G1C97_0499 [Bifidobacterium sp. DSM 109959]|uniref:Uncharacterized protein n=1 Tax=Bifidobacterium olomucense TaxID=2675324 RepID=A0A7Y0EW63_9BIFI|nr:hypothetical protein [Bifidobacterium sp. DSM 109959]
MAMHLDADDGALYGREVLLQVLIDIRGLVGLQHEMEEKRRSGGAD